LGLSGLYNLDRPSRSGISLWPALEQVVNLDTFFLFFFFFFFFFFLLLLLPGRRHRRRRAGSSIVHQVVTAVSTPSTQLRCTSP